ncbi:cupin domain-containing protein [Desulfosporosinus sp. SB140]|uniref:cupin domain-containing protein n=1 Tax=Desulfosporosinus paludis TaxID=3115649 RepID=UPI00388DFBA1
MLKHVDSLKKETVFERFGGKGELQITHFLEGDEFNGKGRLFAKNVLLPGASLGLHQHNGDFETYVILSGEGQLNDNGELKAVKPGDVVITNNGEKHSLENTGSGNLEFLALVIFN